MDCRLLVKEGNAKISKLYIFFIEYATLPSLTVKKCQIDMQKKKRNKQIKIQKLLGGATKPWISNM